MGEQAKWKNVTIGGISRATDSWSIFRLTGNGVKDRLS